MELGNKSLSRLNRRRLRLYNLGRRSGTSTFFSNEFIREYLGD